MRGANGRRMAGGAVAWVAVILAGATGSSGQDDPRLSSWLTEHSGQYARIVETDAERAAWATKTTWSRNALAQAQPVYSGVQEILSSTNWVYLRTSGMGFHVMGPWYLNAARTQIFPNLPVNAKVLYRLPRALAVPATRVLTGLGAIGYFVDGVAMFDSRDGNYWNGTAETGGAGTGYWNRDAYVNEGATFDPALAHQEQTGMYHYHANPAALRYLLGDHVTFNATSGVYAESTNAPTAHSPILGWVRDGAPIYGPIGYADPTNAASGVRRLVSGYRLRNGANGTDNLAVTGRSTIPNWAMRAYGVGASQSGPAVSATYPLGRYMEDNAYRGDLGETLGVEFDLDEFNGRYGVTPEFPEGVYAYFVAVENDGTPVFPYNIGRRFYGDPTGAAVTTIAEAVTTHFVGGADVQPRVADMAADALNGTVTMTWSGAEGGTYVVEGGTDYQSWAAVTTGVSPSGVVASAASAMTNGFQVYRLVRTAIAAYDPVTNASAAAAGGITAVNPTAGARGAGVLVTITLDAAANPPVPPQNAPVLSATIGTIAGTGTARQSQYSMTSTFTIPLNATTGPQTVTVVFPGPPESPTDTRTFTLVNGFTVQ